jgi:hypothetical protein
MTHPLIAAALAAPKTHKCVTRLADGSVREFETRSEASADVHAVGERRKIGRVFLSRETNLPVPVVISVHVERI